MDSKPRYVAPLIFAILLALMVSFCIDENANKPLLHPQPQQQQSAVIPPSIVDMLATDRLENAPTTFDLDPATDCPDMGFGSCTNYTCCLDVKIANTSDCLSVALACLDGCEQYPPASKEREECEQACEDAHRSCLDCNNAWFAWCVQHNPH